MLWTGSLPARLMLACKTFSSSIYRSIWLSTIPANLEERLQRWNSSGQIWEICTCSQGNLGLQKTG